MISRVLRIQRLRWPFNLVISVLVALFAPLSFWLGQDVGLSDLAILRLIVVLIVGGVSLLSSGGDLMWGW